MLTYSAASFWEYFEDKNFAVNAARSATSKFYPVIALFEMSVFSLYINH